MFPEPTTEFLVEVDLVAEMAVFNPFDFFLEPYAEKGPFTYEAPARELRPFLETETPGPSWPRLARTAFSTTRLSDNLNQRLRATSAT